MTVPVPTLKLDDIYEHQIPINAYGSATLNRVVCPRYPTIVLSGLRKQERLLVLGDVVTLSGRLKKIHVDLLAICSSHHYDENFYKIDEGLYSVVVDIAETVIRVMLIHVATQKMVLLIPAKGEVNYLTKIHGFRGQPVCQIQ